MTVTVKRTIDKRTYQMDIKGGPAGGDYISVTGEISSTAIVAGRRHTRIDAMGAIGGELVKVFPWAEKLVALHLSDNDGVPMHAAANGWYWAGGSEYNSPNPNDPPNSYHLASHLRIPQEDAEDIVRKVALKEMSKPEFEAFVQAQYPRWKDEAREAFATIRQNVILPEQVRPLEQTTTRLVM